jgi:hypothetical protein
VSDPLDTATDTVATTTEATAPVADSSTASTTTDTVVSPTAAPTDTAAGTTDSAPQTDTAAPTSTPTESGPASPTTSSSDSSTAPTSATDSATATHPTTDSVDSSTTATTPPNDGITSSPAPGDSLDPSSTASVIPTTDAVQSTAPALPSPADGPTLTSGTDPAGSLGGVVPSTDLPTAATPDTTLTPVLAPTASDPAGTLNSIVPSTDLPTAPTPDTTLTSVLAPTASDPAGTLNSIVPTTDLSTAPTPDAAALTPVDASQLLAGAAEADPGHAASVVATQPVSESVTHAATARIADVAATNADPVMQAVSTADDPIAQTIAAATQPAVHATAEGAGVVAGAAQPFVDVAAATTPPLTGLGDLGQPFDAAAAATGIAPAGAQSLADGMGTASFGNEAIGSMPHELASALAASTHPAVDGSAHAGPVLTTGIDDTAATAVSAAGSGDVHLSLPPLDPTYLRYVGLAGLVGLTMQAAARWAQAAGGCGVPTRLALRQFRLLPCMAVGSVERMAHAALAVGSGSGSASGTAGQTTTRSTSPRGSRAESPADRRTMGPGRPGSAATQVVEIVVLTALVLLNLVLVAIRDTFRRNNGA